jgi:uncharacterized membrane protein
MSTAANTSEISAEAAPRRNVLRILSFVFLILAIGVAGYLTYAKLANQSMICIEDSSIFNCSIVESSAYARILGIPTALWGLVTYIVILALLILETRVGFLREYGLLLIFGIVLFAFVYHTYLTLTAIFTIGALCPWCLTAHTMITLLLITSGIRLWRYFKSA